MDELTLAGRDVTISNRLNRYAHKLSLSEKRLICAAITKLSSSNLKATVTAREYANTFDVSLDTAYDQMKDSRQKLLDLKFFHVIPTPTGDKEIGFHWLHEYVYHHGEGWIDIEFHERLRPHLLELKKTFTRYKLERAAALASPYSWRLLELLMQFKSTGLLRIDIEEFNFVMDAPASARKNFKDLRKCVIEPAVKELTEKSGLVIEWTQRKAGRRVTGLDFMFSETPQAVLPLEAPIES